MSIKIGDLKSLEQCERSYFLSRNIETDKGSQYYMAIGIRNAIKNAIKNKDASLASIQNTLNQSMPDSAFLPLVKETNVNLMTSQIIRYLAYLIENFTVVDMDVTEDINVGGELITVSADLVLMDKKKKTLHITKIIRNEPSLTYGGRKYESLPKNNIELYSLKLLGVKKYPEATVFGAFHHLKGKNDNPNQTILEEFEAKPGYNIISWGFEEPEEINGVLTRLLRKSKDVTFAKVDDKEKCGHCSFSNICGYKMATVVTLEKVRDEVKAPQNFTLTPSQMQAVLLEKGISRINAGAGSGKTTVVALRVNELILNGCDPKDIFLTTFTNKGAQEMRDKVRYWLAKEGQELSDEDLNVTTFNSWGDKIIRDNFKALGFSEEPQLLEKVDKFDILFEILGKNPVIPFYDYRNPLMDFRHAHGAVVRLSNAFDLMKANNITKEKQFKDFPLLAQETVIATQILDMFRQYSEILKERNLIEYQDQINLIAQMMEDDSLLMKQYDYKHVIVDEFQDTDKIQVDLVMFLANQPKFESLMVVGDDSQAIFGFRNTTNENILNFKKMFKKVKDIQIVENFRSTKEIVTLANYLNSLNKSKLAKTLTSTRSGELPVLVGFVDTDSEFEHQKIASKIAGLIQMNYKPEDIAVISRTKDELFEIQKLLDELKVPYVLDVPEPLLNNIRIHMTKNLAQFIGDAALNQGLFEYLMLLTKNFEGMNEGKIALLFEENKESFKELLQETEDEELNEEMKREAFFAMVEEIEDKELGKFVKELKKKNFSFAELRTYLKKFVEYEDPKTIEKNEGRYQAVTLTTAHTSKGKEFKVVFNTITKYLPDNSPEAIEEERRLLFVSITRAKELLFVTYSTSSKSKSSQKYRGFPEELAASGKMASKTL